MTPRFQRAISCWNMLSNGMGGIDWNGFPLALARFGVDDLETLMDDLNVIKTHKPDDEEGS